MGPKEERIPKVNLIEVIFNSDNIYCYMYLSFTKPIRYALKELQNTASCHMYIHKKGAFCIA